MIYGNKDADGRTGPSHIASMKPLENPHDVILPRRTIHFEPPAKSVIPSVDGQLNFSISNILEPEGSGSRLTYHLEVDSGMRGIFGKLADPLVQKTHTRTVHANVETLADLLTEHPRPLTRHRQRPGPSRFRTPPGVVPSAGSHIFESLHKLDAFRCDAAHWVVEIVC
jgi:hypothetical protein